MSAPAIEELLVARSELARAASRAALGEHRGEAYAYRARRLLEDLGKGLTQRVRAVDLQRRRREGKS